MKCAKCASENPDDKLFCGGCGSPISTSVVYFEEKLDQKVQSAVDAQFKDQRLVSIDTASQVLTTVADRAKI